MIHAWFQFIIKFFSYAFHRTSPTISESKSAPVFFCFLSNHCTHSLCFLFFVSNSVHQNSIWFLPHLVNIQTKNTKTESFKNVEYKKNEKSRKLRLIFPFSGTAVSENSLFHCCFVRVCVFLVLVFTWILAWVCTLYCFIIDLLWKSIHHFICYCFAMSTSAIWLSTFVLLILLFSSILVPF